MFCNALSRLDKLPEYSLDCVLACIVCVMGTEDNESAQSLTS
jgi:hypothetical protein